MKPIASCEFCTKEFYKNRKDKRFCSKICKEFSRNVRLGYTNISDAFYYAQYKKDCCDKCGFVPIDKCQLDVDHINGDHSDNRIENLQTLCANCHRLKTKLCKEGLYSTIKKRS